MIEQLKEEKKIGAIQGVVEIPLNAAVLGGIGVLIPVENTVSVRIKSD